MSDTGLKQIESWLNILIPMRVSEKSEKIGLDMSQHDERYGIETNRELAEYFDHGVDTKS